MALTKMYHPTTDGLSGNDDCGQMSAWYIFSALGFYPVAPGSDEYAIGSPSVRSAVVQLENGRTFTVDVKNQGDKNVYIEKIYLNDIPINRNYLKHAEIMQGGKLSFVMSAVPSKKLYSR
jgi:putative alpha-1,2-mannosidase